MNDVGAFRDRQVCSTTLTERERALEVRRQSVMELRHNLQSSKIQYQARVEQFHSERAKYAQRKAQQDEKIGAKETQARLQQERVHQLVSEEETLTAALSRCEQDIDQVTRDTEKRRDLEGALHEAKDRLAQLKLLLEDRDAKVVKLEARIARQEVTTDKRHAVAAEQLPQYWLSRVVDTSSLEETAGESILLIDEVKS